MSRNSNQKRALKKRKVIAKQPRTKQPTSSGKAEFIIKLQALIGTLTTPSEITDRVEEFCAQLSIEKPIFLDCQPEPWSRQSCCDGNVLEYIKKYNGEIVFGYRIWANEPAYIEGERHAIWRNGENLRDVSFVDTGETRTLFLPDAPDRQLGFDDRPQKVRYAFTDHDRKLVLLLDRAEAAAPFGQMTREESWATMPTFEEWKTGKRMPNYVPIEMVRT